MSTPAVIDFCMAGEELIELKRTADAGAADAQHKERLGAAVLPWAQGEGREGPSTPASGAALRPVAAVCGLPERQVPGPQGPGLGALGAIPGTAVHPAPVS